MTIEAYHEKALWVGLQMATSSRLLINETYPDSGLISL